MVKRPFISVIVLAHDAERHVLRTLESVLDQDFDDVQLVVCDCASHDRTAAICRRCAEREIRLDVIELEDTDRSLAFDRALGVARGRYVLVLGQNDWLAPRALEHLHALLTEHDLELAILALSVDEDSGNGERSSHRLSFDVAPTRTKDEFRDQAPLFLADGIFNALKGKVLDRDRVDALGLRMQLCGNEVSYLVTYLEDIERVGVAGQAVCHVAQQEMLDRFRPHMPAVSGTMSGTCNSFRHGTVTATKRFWLRSIAYIYAGLSLALKASARRARFLLSSATRAFAT